VVPVSVVPDEPVETTIDLREALSDGLGQVVALVEPTKQPPEEWRRQEALIWAQVTRIGLTAFVDDTRMVAWATGLADGKPLPRFVRQPGGEIWILAVTATGTRPYFRLAGSLREDGTIRPEKGAEGDLVPGQLLLAPADERDTRALREKFDKVPGLTAPDSWPGNAWK